MANTQKAISDNEISFLIDGGIATNTAHAGKILTLSRQQKNPCWNVYLEQTGNFASVLDALSLKTRQTETFMPGVKLAKISPSKYANAKKNMLLAGGKLVAIVDWHETLLGWAMTIEDDTLIEGYARGIFMSNYLLDRLMQSGLPIFSSEQLHGIQLEPFDSHNVIPEFFRHFTKWCTANETHRELTLFLPGLFVYKLPKRK